MFSINIFNTTNFGHNDNFPKLYKTIKMVKNNGSTNGLVVE